MWYYWERYGYERASEFFLQQYIADKGHVKRVNNMANVIGKLIPENGEGEIIIYLNLKSRFALLLGLKIY
jgi:hypothetical protein